MENESGGGGFLKQKFMGIPAWMFLAGAAVIGYLYFSHKNAAASTPTNKTTGGGGTVHTGKTVVQSGAVRINVRNNGGTGGDEEPQPKPPVPHRKMVRIVVPKNETWAQLGESRHWDESAFDVLQSFTQPKGSTYAGTRIANDQPLHKGDVVYRPTGDLDTSVNH